MSPTLERHSDFFPSIPGEGGGVGEGGGGGGGKHSTCGIRVCALYLAFQSEMEYNFTRCLKIVYVFNTSLPCFVN